MTARDNQLTEGARNAASPSATTYAAADLRVFVNALERLGYRPDSLLAAAGVPAALLQDPDARIPCDRFAAVIGRAMQERPMKNLGVRMAVETPIGSFPLLDYLVVTSSSVGEGVTRLARYFRLVGSPTTLDLREDGNPIRVMAWAGNNFLALEFTLSLTVLNLRQESDGQCNPDFVAFAHVPDDAAEIEKILACEVRSKLPWSGVALSREAWRLPLRRRDSALGSLLERQADEIVTRLPPEDGIALEVRRVLARRVARGDVTIASVAREMATTPRTLQRRLAAARLSFQDVVEQTRQEAAEKYLTDLSLSIAEVSYLLGYSEPSALHRAFKRWKGVTPQAFREGVASDNSLRRRP